jgi:hypothetical protein
VTHTAILLAAHQAVAARAKCPCFDRKGYDSSRVEDLQLLFEPDDGQPFGELFRMLELGLNNNFAPGIDKSPSLADSDGGQAVFEVQSLVEGRRDNELAGGVDESVFPLPHP